MNDVRVFRMAFVTMFDQNGSNAFFKKIQTIIRNSSAAHCGEQRESEQAAFEKTQVNWTVQCLTAVSGGK